METNELKEPEAIYGKQHYNYADYLKFSYDDMVEIIRGKLFKMSPAPSSLHQRISGRLFTIISNHLWDKRCKVFHAPFDVILPVSGKEYLESDKIVQPDITIICNPDLIKERGCFGSPDWIIEILLPHTAKKDVQDKFDIYEESGVKEYWIVEPKNLTVEVFVLKDNKYQRIRTYIEEDVIPCHTLECLEIRLKEVFEI